MLAHNRALTAEIITGIEEIGLTLATPRPESRRGGSIMLRLNDDISTKNLLENMRREGLHADARGQTLRLSPGNITSPAGVAAMLAVLRQQVRKNAA